eukprot:7785_1
MYSFHDPTWKTLKNEDPEEIFDIIEPLGLEADKTVYKALNKRDGNIVALKIKPIDELFDTMKKGLESFQSCKSSHILTCYGTYIKANNMWLSMEYCEAKSVTDVMHVTKRNLTEQEIQIIMHEALKGLIYLHSNKKSHKNIKASNILLNHRGACKLADFGFSNNQTSSAYWIAPEQISHGKRKASISDQSIGKSDIWALGVTAIEMATGKPPYYDILPFKAIFVIANANPPTLPTKDNNFSKDFQDFIACCTIKDPAKRPSANELLQHKWIKNAENSLSLRSLVRMAIQQKDNDEKDMNGQSDTDTDENDNSVQGTLTDCDQHEHEVNITEEFNSLYNVGTEKTEQQDNNVTDDDDDVWWIDDDENTNDENDNTSTESVGSLDSMSQKNAVIENEFSSNDTKQGMKGSSSDNDDAHSDDVYSRHFSVESVEYHGSDIDIKDKNRGRGVTTLVQTNEDANNERYEELKFQYDNLNKQIDLMKLESEQKASCLMNKLEGWKNRYELLRSTYDAIKKDYGKKDNNIKILKQENNRLVYKNNGLMKELINLRNDEKKENNMLKNEICKLKFKNWLKNSVKLNQYLINFEQHECADIRMIEFLDEDTINNDIGIKHKLHRKLILKKAKQFKYLQIEFFSMLENNKELSKYKLRFEENGIITFDDLYNDIQTKQQCCKILKIRDNNTLNKLWNIISTQNEQSEAIVNEGQPTTYSLDMMH